MNFWVKDFHLKRSLFLHKRFIFFRYFDGYSWRKQKAQLPLSDNADMSFYTNIMLNAITEDLKKRGLYEEYRRIIPFIEQLNRSLLSTAIKLGR